MSQWLESLRREWAGKKGTREGWREPRGIMWGVVGLSGNGGAWVKGKELFFSPFFLTCQVSFRIEKVAKNTCGSEEDSRTHTSGI